MAVQTIGLAARIHFRQPKGGVLEGPAVRGGCGLQVATTWIVVTCYQVGALAAYGTVWRLLADNGAASGSGSQPADGAQGAEGAGAGRHRPAVGSSPISLPRPTVAWRRPHLVLPDNEMIELHVTSLDVIHSFWAYQRSVKADANPDVDNIVFCQADQARDLQRALLGAVRHLARLRCFHHGQGRHSDRAFQTWIHEGAESHSRRRRRSCSRTARHIYPNPRGARNEHDGSRCKSPAPAPAPAAAGGAPARLQPP